MTELRLTLAHSVIAERTGRGVRVAVVDSGVAAGHPHVGDVAAGVSLITGADPADFSDRIGHGTAVAAAIREKAPDVEVLAVRVFDRQLSTSANLLAEAIRWATDHGARVINLSLGTPNESHASLLRAALTYAAYRRAIVVAAYENEGTPMLPGALNGAIGVKLDADCPREELRVLNAVPGVGRPLLGASGFPRPIPGVPPERNLYGISFAVASASAFIARAIECEATLSAAQVVDRLALLAR